MVESLFSFFFLYSVCLVAAIALPCYFVSPTSLDIDSAMCMCGVSDSSCVDGWIFLEMASLFSL